MAVIDFVKTQGPGRTFHYVWAGLATGDTGRPVVHPGAADMTVQFFGTFGAATIILEGSCQVLTGAVDTFFTMKDGGDNNISKTAADGEAIAPMAASIRPRVSGGSNVDLTCILFLRSTMR